MESEHLAHREVVRGLVLLGLNGVLIWVLIPLGVTGPQKHSFHRSVVSHGRFSGVVTGATVWVMVVETLTFEVAESEREQWLAVEEEVWSRFLEAQPGFVRKEMWASCEDPGAVQAVIWWESMDQWKAIGPERVAEVDARMGPWLRDATMHAFDRVRDC